LRSFILVVVAGFALALGALVYFWMQPSGHGRRGGRQRLAATGGDPLKLQASDSGSPVGPGEHVWLKKHDQRTGELASEFIAEEYTPLKGGRVSVKDAKARFYMSNGQVLQIHGNSGLFSSNSNPPKQKAGEPPRAPAPTRGELHDVLLTIFDAAERPTMTVTMNNASFDSESSTIYTEGYTDPANGQWVPADQVKVEIRSPETNPNGYDFDGRGLRIAWNERDHRLSKLDVAHGERLVIKNPKMIMQPKSEPRPTGSTDSTTAAAPALAQMYASLDDHVMLAAATQQPDEPAKPRRNRAAKTQPSASQPMRAHLAPNTDPPIYRATFYQSVRIVQNDQPLATADRMLVDFWMKSDDDKASLASSSTQPTTQASGRHATTKPRPQPQSAALATTSPATQPATTQPVASADETPIYIYWSGPLHVEPYPEASVADGESVVTLEGTPVIAKQQNSDIRASKLIYRTEDGSLRGASVPGAAVVMTSNDSHGTSIIRTTALEYLARATPPVAILSGKSSAELPVTGQADGPKMNAAWTNRCTLRFETFPDHRTAIKEADLTGDVKVDHPQLKLASQRLELAFDVAHERAATTQVASTQPATQPSTRPTTQPAPLMQTNLKQLVASDSVHCVMTGSDNKTQMLDGDRLTLLTEATAEGRMVPRTVNVDGSVHAVDQDQDLRAGHVAVTLVPSTRPVSTRPAATKPSDSQGVAANVDLQSLIAHDGVHVIGKKDGTEAFADTMLVDKKDGISTAKLVGQPFAKIIQKNNVITGPVIDIAPDSQQLSVDGAGAMHGTQQQEGGATTKPIDVTWTRSLHVDGKQNVVDALGAVVASTTDADGTVNTVRGDRAQLLLADAPPTTRPATSRPTTHTVATTGPTTHPTTKPTATGSSVPPKVVRQATFSENASVSSTLLDNDGLPLRRMNVFAATIQYDVVPPETPEGAATPKVTIPGGGRMLVEDYRPAATQPAAANTNSVGSARGATAFQWSRSLVYDDASHRAVMDGSVVIDHRDDVQKEDSMRLTGDRVTAILEPLGAPPATQPAATTKPNEPRYQVRQVIANGNLLVTMRGGELTADTIVYDPLTHILTARGNDRSDVVFTRAQSGRGGAGGAQPIRAQEMQWDAQSDLPKITKVAARLRK
jgi:lipopolysaccharide export system protein LptA